MAVKYGPIHNYFKCEWTKCSHLKTQGNSIDFKKQDPCICCPQKTHCGLKTHKLTADLKHIEIERKEKNTPYKWKQTNKHKKLVEQYIRKKKIPLKIKSVTRDLKKRKGIT